MQIKYLLLNYFTNNFFYNNGNGTTYDARTESTINRMNAKDEIYEICDELEEWYNNNTAAIEGIFKSQGIASKSLDSFSVSYNTTITQSAWNLLPFTIWMKLDSLGLINKTVVTSTGGFLW